MNRTNCFIQDPNVSSKKIEPLIHRVEQENGNLMTASEDAIRTHIEQHRKVGRQWFRLGFVSNAFA